MKAVFVRYLVKECVGKSAIGASFKVSHVTDIIDIENKHIEDMKYIKDRLSEMYGFSSEQIDIKYVRLWQ